MHGVLIIDSMGTLNRMSSEVENRHREYAQLLHEYTNGLGFLGIISVSRFEQSLEFSEFYKHWKILGNRRLSPKFIYRTTKLINNLNLDRIILIAADPWESYINCQFIAALARLKNVSIQIQLHADIGDDAWRNQRKVFRIRFHLAKYTIHRADSLRLVSQTQMNKLLSRGFLIPKNTFIAPVPLNFQLENSLKIRQDFNSKLVVGFVGRMESDRGLNAFLEFVKVLSDSSYQFEVFLVGEGSLKNWMLKKLTEIAPKSRIRITKATSTQEMSQVWEEITLLVSTAPAESYGRSIREALIHGVPVLAIPSSGADEVAKLTQSLGFIDRNFPEKTLTNLGRVLDSGVNLETRKKLLDLNGQTSKLLVDSWNNLLLRGSR